MKPKSRLFAALLAFIFGWISLNDFYLGNTGTGVIKLVISILFAWIGGTAVISIINLVRGCQYLWCDSDEEMMEKYGPSEYKSRVIEE